MQIIVLIKQVPDTNSLRIDRATGKPVPGAQLTINSADEYAIEESLQIRESQGGEVAVVTAGPASAKDAVTRALAMGADNGLLIPFDNVNDVDTLAVAEAIVAALAGRQFDLLLGGYSTDDGDSAQVLAQVSELLGLPFISSVVELEFSGALATAHRDMEDGKQTVTFELPAAVSAIAGLNEPRYPSLKGIMAAKKKPLEITDPVSATRERVSWGDTFIPERESTGTILTDVPAADAAAQLVVWLRAEKLID